MAFLLHWVVHWVDTGCSAHPCSHGVATRLPALFCYGKRVEGRGRPSDCTNQCSFTEVHGRKAWEVIFIAVESANTGTAG